MKKSTYMSVVLASLLTLTGCGGGGGSSSSSSISTKSIEGTAYDPEIVGADVTLVCGNNKYYAVSRTNDSGYFKIDKIPSSQDLKTCVLESTGGMDAAEDFKNLTLKAPVSMFDLSSNDKIYITPLTTMVANDDDSASDISKALDDVAAFLGNKDKKLLNKKPSGEMAKIAKKLTLIAMSEKDGKKIGFKALDIDNISKDDINPENTSLISDANTKAELKEVFTSIDSIADNNAQMALEIKKLSVKRSVKKLLRSAYNLPSSDAKYDEYKANINSFSEKITQALKDGENYKAPTRHIIRKALSDGKLSVSFKSDGTLSDDLYEKLTKQSADFEALFTNVNLDIKNLKGVTLYEVEKYSKIVANDNDLRMEYYTFSDVSHLSEAVKIAKTSYDDSVLDPIYKKIAVGYAKLGFNQEALSLIDESIFTQLIKVDSYIDLTEQLVLNNQNNEALSSLNLAFEGFKNYAKGDESRLTDNDLKYIIRILKNYNVLKNRVKSDELIAYMNTDVLKGAKPITFNTLSGAFSDLINQAIFDKRKDDMIYLSGVAADFILKVPYDENDTASRSYFHRAITNVLPYMAISGLKDKGDKLIALGKKSTTFMTSDSAEELVLSHELITDISKMNEKAAELDSYTGDDSKTKISYNKLLRNGLALALVVNNQKDLAVKLITKYWASLSYGNFDPAKVRPDVFKFYVNKKKAYASTLLGVIDNSKQEEFLKALLEDSKVKENPKDAWTFIRTGSSSRDKNKDMYVGLFNNFGTEIGYPTIIRQFAENGSYGEIKEVINVASEYINNKIETPIYKIQSTVTLLKVLSEFDYFSKVSEDALQTKLNNDVISLVDSITIDANASTYRNDVNFSIQIAKYLADSNQLIKAKEILKKIQDSLVTPTDSTSAKLYMNNNLGVFNYGNGADGMNDSLLGAYIKTQQFKEARDLIFQTKTYLDIYRGKTLDINEDFITIAKCYGAINQREDALKVIEKITTVKQKNLARLHTTEYLSNFDAFPDTNVASIDTDGDGKPDFFNKFASQDDIKKSGLVLDEDIDGDKVNDDVDNFPYSKDLK